MSTAVDNLADNLKNASLEDTSAANNDAVLASAAEGRRLYIGNLAYATTEAELKQFFSGYDVYVASTFQPSSINQSINQPTADMILK
jgi:RNA recognition motif-containing protein